MASKKNKKATTNTANLPALRSAAASVARMTASRDGSSGRTVYGEDQVGRWRTGHLATRRAGQQAHRNPRRRRRAGDRPGVRCRSGRRAEPDQPAPAAEETTAATEMDQRMPRLDTAGTTPRRSNAQTEPTATAATSDQHQTEAATVEPARPTTEPTASEPRPRPPKPSGTDHTEHRRRDGESVAKPKRQRKAPAEPKEKKMSALDAAARVLAEAGCP